MWPSDPAPDYANFSPPLLFLTMVDICYLLAEVKFSAIGIFYPFDLDYAGLRVSRPTTTLVGQVAGPRVSVRFEFISRVAKSVEVQSSAQFGLV